MLLRSNKFVSATTKHKEARTWLIKVDLAKVTILHPEEVTVGNSKHHSARLRGTFRVKLTLSPLLTNLISLSSSKLKSPALTESLTTTQLLVSSNAGTS